MSWENIDNGLSMHNKVAYIDKIGCNSYEGVYTIHKIFIYSTTEQNSPKL